MWDGRPWAGPAGQPGGGARPFAYVEFETLLRRDLSLPRLLLSAVLVASAGLGWALIPAGMEQYAGGDAAGGAVCVGAGGVLFGGAASALLMRARRSREVNRLLSAQLRHPPPVAGLSGLRLAWGTASGAALFLGMLGLGAGLFNARGSGVDSGADPAVLSTFFAWAALLLLAGGTGMRKACRSHGLPPPAPTPPVGPAPLPPAASASFAPYHRTGHAHPGASGPGRSFAAGAPLPLPARPVAPSVPYDPQASADHRARTARLYANNRGTSPWAPHLLSSRLTRLVPSLSRTGIAGVALGAGLLACTLAAVTAFLPVRLGDVTVWPLVALTAAFLLALLLELVQYGTRVGYLLVYAFAALALGGASWYGHYTSVLLDRGEWITAEVTHVGSLPRGGSRCTLRPEGATAELSEKLSSCRDLRPGDRVRVFADPEDRVRPSRSAPAGHGVVCVVGGAAGTLVTASALASVLSGHRRRRELGLLGPPPDGTA